MAKALKPLIVVNLILSGISLTLGIMLFLQREVLKGRVQRNEQGLVEVAKSIRFEDFNVAQLAVAKKEDLGQMDAPLRQLAAAGNNQWEELQTTKADLASTREELGRTKDELAVTKNNLEQARAEIVSLNETIVAKNAEIAQRDTQIAQLEADKVALQDEVKTRDDRIAKMEEQADELKDNIKALDQDIRRIEDDLAQCKGILQPVPVGLSGKVIIVNKDWNFVVLDIGSDAGLRKNAEMLIHRGDKLVGKVLVSELSKTIAVAEIQGDWMEAQVQEGDLVVH